MKIYEKKHDFEPRPYYEEVPPIAAPHGTGEVGVRVGHFPRRRGSLFKSLEDNSLD